MSCLWNWENVHGGNERICYNQAGPFYHKPVKNKGTCAGFECRAPLYRETQRTQDRKTNTHTDSEGEP